MGDPRGFMKVPRVAPKYRPVAERVLDFREVLAEQDEAQTRTQARRCMDCGVPFCQGGSGCPLHNLIPEWNELAADGRWNEALARLHETNNFPEFTSRLCPAPCESACVVGLHSEPVTIKAVERQIIDQGFAQGLVEPSPPGRKTGRRVAIIGSGPAGLAAAQELARRGHSVTVFEKAPRIGGLLRYGIPDFKMEKHLIDQRLAQMQAEGVEFRASTCIGIDVSLAQLRAEYDAVGLAIGAERPRDLLIPGRNLQGVHFAMDYLIAQNHVVAGDVPGPSNLNAEGKTVIVIGGGDTGSDCIGTAHRQGARQVYQFELLPRPPQTRSIETPWPYWPVLLRTSHAHEEGGEREWSLSTKEIRGESGHVTSLIAERVQMIDGHLRPVPGSEVEFQADLIILAMGFTGSVEPSEFQALGFARDARGQIRTSANGETSVNGIFAAGDVVRGASLIVWAIAEGRRMAAGIHAHISTQDSTQRTTQNAEHTNQQLEMR